MTLNNGLPKIKKAWYSDRLEAYYITCICGDSERIQEKDIQEKKFRCWGCLTDYSIEWSETEKTYILTEIVR